MRPRTPAETMRWAAAIAQEEAYKSECAAMRLDDEGANAAFVGVARAEACVLRTVERRLIAEAACLEAAEQRAAESFEEKLAERLARNRGDL